MLDNEVNIYDEYSQYDQTSDTRYENNYTSPPLASESPNNYDVDMEDFGTSRQMTPQQQLFYNSPSPPSVSGLRRFD
jgi:heme-binding NEAT domain protein